MAIFRERRSRRRTEAHHNAGVKGNLIAVVSELFSDGAPPAAARQTTERRLRKLLMGDKQLNLAERLQIEGQVWQHFHHDSQERGYLDDIGFLHWN